MADPNSPSARRRSLAHLLDYALNEAEELGFADIAHFVTLAATTLENMPKPIKRPRKKSSRDAVISLAEFRGRQKPMLGRSSSRRRRK